jgi:hypothetical protein
LLIYLPLHHNIGRKRGAGRPTFLGGEPRTGPSLCQQPETWRFDTGVLTHFTALLPNHDSIAGPHANIKATTINSGITTGDSVARQQHRSFTLSTTTFSTN